MGEEKEQEVQQEEQEEIEFDSDEIYQIKDEVTIKDLQVYKEFGLLDKPEGETGLLELIQNIVFDIIPDKDKAEKILNATVDEDVAKGMDIEEVDAMKLRGSIINFLVEYLGLSVK